VGSSEEYQEKLTGIFGTVITQEQRDQFMKLIHEHADQCMQSEPHVSRSCCEDDE